MGKVIRFVFLAVSVILSAQSCQWALPGEGSPAEIRIPVGPVDSIFMTDVMDVVVVPGDEDFCLLEAGQNQLGDIEAHYDPQRRSLTLGNDAKFFGFNGYGRIRCTVGTRSLSYVSFTVAGGLFFADTLRVPRFTFDNRADLGAAHILLNSDYVTIRCLETAGDYVVAGRSRRLILGTSGYLNLDASGTHADNVVCSHYSWGDCHVAAKRSLRYHLYGDGDLVQHGIVDEISGSQNAEGQLIVVQ